MYDYGSTTIAIATATKLLILSIEEQTILHHHTNRRINPNIEFFTWAAIYHNISSPECYRFDLKM